MSDDPKPIAGWYPDPEGSGGQRYWDGDRWTDAIAGSVVPAPHPPQQQPSTGLLIFGYLAAFVMPIIGFILGIVLLIRGGPETKHGIACVLISVVVGLVACSIALNETENELNRGLRAQRAALVTSVTGQAETATDGPGDEAVSRRANDALTDGQDDSVRADGGGETLNGAARL